MKKFRKIYFISFLSLVLMGGAIAYAIATQVDLGTAGNYAVLAGSGITNTGATTIDGGDVGSSPTNTETGFSGGNTVTITNGANHTDANPNDAATVQAKVDLVTAYNQAAGQTLDQSVVANLAGQTLTPGVYNAATSMDIAVGGTLTLDAQGDPDAVWVFQAGSTLTANTNSTVALINGAQACHVFWKVGSAATLNAGTTFMGTIMAYDDISLGDSVTLTGRLLAGAQGPTGAGAITLINDTITVAECAPILTVTKTVTNDNNGIKTISDFPLFVGATPVTSGVATTFTAGTYTLSETTDAGYTASTWGGDCSAGGIITLVNGDNKVCTITNNDNIPAPPVTGGSGGGGGGTSLIMPPLISIKKLPNPLALPSGPGTVTYTYTVLNVGTTTMNNVTVVDDKCELVNFISGDINNNNLLETSETWTYNCATSVQQTTTNIATATGHAYGLTTSDTASAIVVVSLPLTPPLIHVIKKPNRFVLPYGGGSVKYSYTVTNPGIVALSNVSIVDNKCQAISDFSGDTNDNDLLEPNETWEYDCWMKVTLTTVNTVTAQGSANGLTAIDYASATVVVAGPVPIHTAAIKVTPKLPNTGSGPGKNISGDIMNLASIIAFSCLIYTIHRKQTIHSKS